jgi:obg-like ATPase 1
MEIITGELIAKDIQHLNKEIATLDTEIKRFNKKEAKEEREVLGRVQEMLDKKVPVREGDWKTADIEWLNKHHFMTAKPVVYLVNIGDQDYITKKNKWLPKIA